MHLLRTPIYFFKKTKQKVVLGSSTAAVGISEKKVMPYAPRILGHAPGTTTVVVLHTF